MTKEITGLKLRLEYDGGVVSGKQKNCFKTIWKYIKNRTRFGLTFGRKRVVEVVR